MPEPLHHGSGWDLLEAAADRALGRRRDARATAALADLDDDVGSLAQLFGQERVFERRFMTSLASARCGDYPPSGRGAGGSARRTHPFWNNLLAIHLARFVPDRRLRKAPMRLSNANRSAYIKLARLSLIETTH